MVALIIVVKELLQLPEQEFKEKVAIIVFKNLLRDYEEALTQLNEAPSKKK